MFGFIAPVLSAVSGFFGTTAGAAVATGAATAAVSAVAQADADKKRNAAAEAAYQRQLAEQQKERDRQAAIDAANKSEQLAIDEKNRATAKADAANKYVDMNAAAQKAGLNPLTVLRATGGTGFGAYGGYGAVMRQGLVQPTISAPILSKTSVATQIGLGAVKGFIDYKSNQKANEHYDRLNELDLEQRQLDIKLSKKALGAVDRPQPETVPLVDDNGKPMTDKYGQKIFVPAESNEVIPKFKLVYDQATRETYAIINPELTESGLSEALTGVGIDAAGKLAHQTGTDFSYKGIGFPNDPLGLNRGIKTNDNRTLGWPQLSF
jgi:hypothetical protein